MPAGIHVIVEDADHHDSRIAVAHLFAAIVENVRCRTCALSSV
jgi:hypothetical protein